MRGKRRIPAAVILLAAAISALLAGGAYAKYVRSVSVEGSITFSANLAEEFRLAEHNAVRNPDGSYTLSGLEEMTENMYTVMPGVDIPKDPCVIIGKKSAADAWLYIEVVGSPPDGVSFSMTENWLLLTDAEGKAVTGPNSGKVYVYGADGEPAMLDESFSDASLPLLQDNMVYVSDRVSGPAEFSLTFYGYLLQIPKSGGTAAEIFAGFCGMA